MAAFDFAVVGGGPAGLAAATLLATGGARVLLIDDVRTRRAKAGEFIHPQVKSFINGLAILPQGWEKQHLPVHGFVNGWASASPQEVDFIYDPHGEALALDRRLFERQLLQAATERGVDTRLGYFAEAVSETDNSGWQINLTSKTDVKQHQARYLLMATGRNGVHPTGNIERQRHDRLSFLAANVPGLTLDGRPLIEGFQHGWVYVTPVPGDAAVIYVFFDPACGTPCDRALKSLRTALKSCVRLSGCLDGVIEDQDHTVQWFAGTAHSGIATRSVGKNWCLLGDVAQSWDPLSASGMFNALGDASRMSVRLLSGRLTAEALVEIDAERARSFADYLQARRSYYEQETRWSDLPFWSGRGGTIAGALQNGTE